MKDIFFRFFVSLGQESKTITTILVQCFVEILHFCCSLLVLWGVCSLEAKRVNTGLFLLIGVYLSAIELPVVILPCKMSNEQIGRVNCLW